MSAVPSLEPAVDPFIGKVLGDRYKIVRRLGEGGMGAVYEGKHLLIGKSVAIKLLHPQFASSSEMVARFQQEARAATAIGHPNIIEVNDLGTTPEGAIFMVLELLAGHDFASVLERETILSVARTVHIVSQVCDAVQAAHDKGIVHRDLKPENIFLVKRGESEDFVKVLDFGISKIQGGSVEGQRSATRTGSIIGTAYYMSPEQAQGKKSVDHRTDVWALGVILFRALTAHYPFDDTSYPMLIVKIVTEAPPRLSSFRPDVPNELEAIVHRCLERDVDARVQSCAELRTLLRPFATLIGRPPALDRTMAPVEGEGSSAATGPMSDPEYVMRILENAPGTRPATSTPPAPAPVPVTRSTPPLVSTVRERAPSGTSWTTRAAIGGSVTVALAAVGWTLANTVAPPPAPVAPTVAVAPPLAPALPPPPPEAQPPAAEAEAERIEFIVSPTDAVVLVDGRRVAPTADGTIASPIATDDTTLHELRVEARGFRSRVEDLRTSYPQRVVVALEPGSGEEDLRSAHADDRESTRHTRGTRETRRVDPVGGAPPPLLTREEP